MSLSQVISAAHGERLQREELQLHEVLEERIVSSLGEFQMCVICCLNCLLSICVSYSFRA